MERGASSVETFDRTKWSPASSKLRIPDAKWSTTGRTAHVSVPSFRSSQLLLEQVHFTQTQVILAGLITPGRPRKYKSEEERRIARKEQARARRREQDWEQRQYRRAGPMDNGLKALIGQVEAQKQRRKRNPTGLTNKQKRELAHALIQAAGAIVGNLRAQACAGLDPSDAAKQLALWLKDLPGDHWDKRLGQRKINYFFTGTKPEWEPGIKVDLKFP